ncbi:tyrosine-type recombinase/integrase [Nonomuraea sp. NPDC050394]|uniref:tyrosine-type recombinase/integrase n=1 Tax=Nonomuraea sp. NPDC050394 TaxID=3364363 RepID=UPI0037B3B422
MEDGLAAHTRIAYARDFAAYAAWCESNGRSFLPATAATLANYVAHLAAQKYAPSSIDRALACVLAAHNHAGLGKPATTAARLALRAYRRERAQQGRRPRRSPPITVDRLRAMVTAPPNNTPTGLRDRAVLVLGFALMSRRSEITEVEITEVEITDIAFTAEGMEVFVPFSKTDQDGDQPVEHVRLGGRVALRQRPVAAQPFGCGGDPQLAHAEGGRQVCDDCPQAGDVAHAFQRGGERPGEHPGVGQRGGEQATPAPTTTTTSKTRTSAATASTSGRTRSAASLLICRMPASLTCGSPLVSGVFTGLAFSSEVADFGERDADGQPVPVMTQNRGITTDAGSAPLVA